MVLIVCQTFFDSSLFRDRSPGAEFAEQIHKQLDHDLLFFVHSRQHSERHKQFAGYTRAVIESDGTHFRHLVKGFD